VELEIRTAGRDDFESVLAVWAVARSPAASTTDDVEVLGALLDRDPDALLVAVAGGRVVGAMIVGYDGWRGGMYRLGVVPSMRRRGVARALVSAAHERLRRLGARRVGAHVAPDEADAVALWESAGYAYQPEVARFVRNL
jgi:ribosomal protein S18 acetylase RimI-like enzyme